MKVKQILSSSNCIIEFCGNEIGYLQNFKINVDYGLQDIRNLWQDTPQNFVAGNTRYTAAATHGVVEIGSITGLVANSVDILTQLQQFTSNGGLNFNIPGSSTGVGGAAGSTQNSVEKQLESIGSIAAVAASSVDTVKSIFSSIPGFRDFTDKPGNKISGNPSDLPDFSKRINLIKDMWSSFKKSDKVDIMKEIFTRAEFDIVIKNPITSSSGILDLLVDTFKWDEGAVWKLKGCKLSGRSIDISQSSIVVMQQLNISCKSMYDGMIAKGLRK